MELKIYNREGVLKLTASPSDNATRQKRLMGDHVLNLSFTAFACVPLEVFDYADFDGVRFRVMEEYAPKQTSSVEWEYDCTLYGIESLMKQALVLNTVEDESNPIFSLTAPAREHMALIVRNINRQMGTTDWKVGEVIATGNLTLDYEGTYCDEALAMLAEAAKTEYWTDGMTLNLCRCDYGAEVPLGYGNGLLSLERETAGNVRFFTRLFPIGSTRNIDPEQYGHSRLQLPGDKPYVEHNTHLGIVEHYEQEAFSAIYPRRVGTLSAVRSEQRTGRDGKPFTIYHVQDADLPFDPNDYEIGGLVKQMTFRSGELSGRDFEVNYDPKRKEFEIITQWPYDDDTQLPGGVLVPKAGDEYILWNIRMPAEYYALAEQEFARAVDEYLAEHDRDRYVYKGRTDYVEVARRGLKLDVGQRVRLESGEYFPGAGYRTSRITSVTQNLHRPSEMEIEVSDLVGKGALERINEELGEVRHDARTASAALPDLIRSWENTPASDTALYSSRKIERDFLAKRTGGTVEGPVRFEQPVVLDGGFRTPDFASGPTGFGGRLDGLGHAELESLVLRRFLDVPELRYNRVDITVGNAWSAPGCGLVESVDTGQRLVTLKLEEGEVGPVRAGDICLGIFHSPAAAENAPADTDDGRGNCTFAGFATVYFRITEVTDERRGRFRYELRPASASYAAPTDPMPGMSFVVYGSFTDPGRRTSRCSTRTYTRYLRDVSDWEFTAENIAAQFGDLGNLSVFGLAMTGYSAYLDNIYLQGLLRSPDGTFIVDTKTRSLLMASGQTGIGLAYNPQQGLMIGAVYDPATGKFKKEFDIEQIDRTAQDAKEGLDNLQYAAYNLVNGSHEDYIKVSTGVPAMEIDHTLIRGKQITYRAELKGEQAQAAHIGFEIRIHFTDNTDQWIALYYSTDVPDRGNFEKVYSSSSQVLDKEIGYAVFYPIFKSYSGDAVSGELFFRHEFVGVGSKLPSTWSPSVADRQAAVEAAQSAADRALTAAAAARQTADGAAEKIDSLKNFTDEAFADGIADRAEAASIEKYVNSVRGMKDAADASYAVVHGSPLLGGSAKQNLQAAKSAFDTAVAGLLAAITTASADGIATAEERADVDACYALFITAYGTYTTRIEEAQRYIQTAINTTAQAAYRLSEQLRTAIDTLNGSIIPDLQHQIDRQIISYNGTEIPALSNYPASEWTTTKERNRHINDYYDRRIIVDGAVAYERYKFVLENNVYQWVRIADSGAAEAQAKAMEALGVAGSKNKVYFGDATPLVPYAINDLWIRTSGIIYICNADRLPGATGSASDWQPVNDAQLRLRQMSSDNVISKEEKAALRNTLAQREKEMAAYRADAATYGVSIAVLNTAYGQLVNFLTGTIAVHNDTDTEITTGQRTSYNSCFAAYDTEVSRFTNLVADKRSKAYTDEQADLLQKKIDAAKQAADDAKTDALAANGELTKIRADGIVTPPEKKDLRLQQADIRAEYAQIVSEAGEYDVPTTAYATAYNAANAALTKYTASTPDYITADSDYANIANYYAARQTILNAIAMAAKRIMDNTAEAVSDVERLKQLFPASVDVDGAVIARTLAVKKDTGSQITGFINGSSKFSDPTHGICMIAMGMSGVTNWSNAKTKLFSDGHFVSSSAEITGEVTATSGKIGGFTIDGVHLTAKSDLDELRLSSGGIRFVDANGKIQLGADVWPPSLGGKVAGPMSIELKRTPLAILGGNIGMHISVEGAPFSDKEGENYSGNHALYIPKGDICGFRPRVRRVSSSQKLTDMDSVILITSSSYIVLTLPANPQEGQMYLFKTSNANYEIKVGNSSHSINDGRWNKRASWQINYPIFVLLVWDSVNKTWQGGYMTSN